MLLTANPSDGPITWIACPPSTTGLLCRCAFGSLAVAARPMLTCDGASCTCRDRVWLAGRLAGTSLAVALLLPHSPHAQTTPVLVMRKSCKMNTGGPPAGFYCPYHYACSIPGATCDVTGLPWSAQTVPFSSRTMALADSSGAGFCSQLAEPASSPSLCCSPAHPRRYR